jgi:Tfp pilus assembly protein PilF
MNRRWLIWGLFGLSSLWVVVLTAGSASAIPQDPKKIDEALTIFNRAKLLHQDGNYEDAIREYQRATRLDNKNPWIFNYLGLAQIAVGRSKDAVKSLMTALKLNPDITDIHNNLGVVYSEMGEREKAFEEFAAVVRDPTYPTPEKPLFNLGNLYFRENNFELALMHYKRAVEKNPSFALGYRGLGKVHLALGEPELAQKQFLTALEHAPSDQESLYEMARIYESQADLENALEFFRRVVQANRFSVFGRLSLEKLDTLKPSSKP